MIRIPNTEIDIITAAGYHDGYYWDMSATVLYKGDYYSVHDAGSGSGYIPGFYACEKLDVEEKPDGLHILKPTRATLMTLCEDEIKDSEDFDEGYIYNTIIMALNDFESLGCCKSFERVEGEHFNNELYVDGKKVED